MLHSHRKTLHFAIALSGIVILVASFIAIMTLSSEKHNQPMEVLTKGECLPNWLNAITITGSDGLTRMCLSGEDKKPLYWYWSPDGSRLAYALLNDTITFSPVDVRHGYVRNPATYWFVIDADGKNQQRFPPADNKGFSFSADGQYAEVTALCNDLQGSCRINVYRIDKIEIVCY